MRAFHCRSIVFAVALFSGVPALHEAMIFAHNSQFSVAVRKSDGAYEIIPGSSSIFQSIVAAEINGRWIQPISHTEDLTIQLCGTLGLNPAKRCRSVASGS
jgi:hypothetical protein